MATQAQMVEVAGAEKLTVASKSRRAWRSQGNAGAGAALLGLALCCLGGKWLPGQTQARPQVHTNQQRSSGAGQGAGQGACGEALSAGYLVFDGSRSAWAAASAEAQPVRDLGSAADAAEKAALAAFDNMLKKQGQPGACGPQRTALVEAIRKEVWSIFLAQRLIAERIAADQLNRQLVSRMTKRGGPLRVLEKINLLRQQVSAYKAAVKRLLPAWAASGADPEEAAAERRLGELQFQIENSAAGSALQKIWQEDRMQQLLSKRAHGISVSLDPALRVLLRPDGLGNLQIFSVGPVGPPNNPATVNVGVMNDGSIADVYREHPEPPRISIQPAVKVNMNVR
eukprot:TRINITY_DN105099_c0_g1_i1.p1 TRINITY_DN105099_c0_g1~~TRINITY_DN105099_c0_g1_i1.p1  ORF type:complete len:341 (-),score=68.98 TRINITY_DN105099_c0_g1_i1:251-1273(-)